MPDQMCRDGQPPGAVAEGQGRGEGSHRNFGEGRRLFANNDGAADSPCRQRDLLPLPPAKTVSDVEAGVRHGSSRSSARRGLRRAYTEEWAEDCVQALNEMFCGRGEATTKPTHGPTVMQRCALRHILRSCAAMGKPLADLDRQGALDGLLAHKCNMGQPVALAPLDVDLLSLPSAGSCPTDVTLLLGRVRCRCGRGVWSTKSNT